MTKERTIIDLTRNVPMDIHLNGRDISPEQFEDALRRWSYPWKVVSWRMVGDIVSAVISVTNSFGYTPDGIGLIVRNALKNAKTKHGPIIVSDPENWETRP